MTKKRILLNAFDMNCPSNQSPGLWSIRTMKHTATRILTIGLSLHSY